MEKLVLRVNQLFTVVLFFVSRILAWFYKSEKELWLVAERGTDARDNGYWMFRYIKEQHPEINVKYIITKESEDRDRLISWSNDLINYGSLQHYIHFWRATKCISTHIGGCYPYIFRVSYKLKRLLAKTQYSKNIFLQHGITKDDIKGLHYDGKRIHLFICGAKPEFEFVSQKFGYPEGIVKYTGFARFDNLPYKPIGKRQILLMPTWRSWLQNENFVSSEYYLKYVEFLSCKLLYEILDEKNVTLVFYPHYEVQKYISEFKKLQLPSNIIIADKKEFDVQRLLIESSLLITDYSSVYFDFVYMGKPVLYYQFDEKRYRMEQYQDGYYDYHNGFGEWTDKLDEIIEKIEWYIRNGFDMPLNYRDRVNDFFPISDNRNRERIFEEISKL